jgi:hypothetical protein
VTALELVDFWLFSPAAATAQGHASMACARTLSARAVGPRPLLRGPGEGEQRTTAPWSQVPEPHVRTQRTGALKLASLTAAGLFSAHAGKAFPPQHTRCLPTLPGHHAPPTDAAWTGGFQRGPGGWIEIKPPTLQDNEFAIWSGSQWAVTTGQRPVHYEPEVITEPVVELPVDPQVSPVVV